MGAVAILGSLFPQVEKLVVAAVEGGNDVTEPESAPHLERTGLVRASDFMGNRRGVWGSVLEINQNIAELPLLTQSRASTSQ